MSNNTPLVNLINQFRQIEEEQRYEQAREWSAQLKQLIKEGADLNTIVDGKPLLFLVLDVKKFVDKKVQLAINILGPVLNGAINIHATDNMGNTALHHAAKIAASSQTIRDLKSQGLDSFTLNNNQETAFHIAAKGDSSRTLSALLPTKKESDLYHLRDQKGQTTLFHVCDAPTDALRKSLAQYGFARQDESSKVNEFKKMIKGGADINAIDNNGNTPLLHLLKNLQKWRVASWHSQGTNGNDYVEYRVTNGLFTYHKNNKKVGFSLKDQKLCAAKPWGPEGQFRYYDGIKIALEIVKTADTSIPDPEGNIPFAIACAIGEPRLVKALGLATSDKWVPNNLGETALHHIAASNRADGLKAFLKFADGIDFNTLDHAHWNPLHHALYHGDDFDSFKLLMKQKISIDQKSKVLKHTIEAANTPKMLAKQLDRQAKDTFQSIVTKKEVFDAVQNGQMVLVQQYLKGKGDPNVQEHGTSLLAYAVRHTQSKIVELLLKKGKAEVNTFFDEEDSIDALMLNVIDLYQKGPYVFADALSEYKEHVKMTQLLIKYGIDLGRIRRSNHQTALRVAADLWIESDVFSDDIAHLIADQLKNYENSAEIVNVRDNEGFSALHMASKHGKVPLMQKLLALGADVSLGDNDNFTPLHEGIIAGKYESVEFLLKNGADTQTTITGSYKIYEPNDNALSMAKKQGDQALIELIEKYNKL